MATEIAKEILQQKSYINAARVKNALEYCLAPQDHAQWREDLQTKLHSTKIDCLQKYMQCKTNHLAKCLVAKNSKGLFSGAKPVNESENGVQCCGRSPISSKAGWCCITGVHGIIWW